MSPRAGRFPAPNDTSIQTVDRVPPRTRYWFESSPPLLPSMGGGRSKTRLCDSCGAVTRPRTIDGTRTIGAPDGRSLQTTCSLVERRSCKPERRFKSFRLTTTLLRLVRRNRPFQATGLNDVKRSARTQRHEHTNPLAAEVVGSNPTEGSSRTIAPS